MMSSQSQKCKGRKEGEVHQVEQGVRARVSEKRKMEPPHMINPLSEPEPKHEIEPFSSRIPRSLGEKTRTIQRVSIPSLPKRKKKLHGH